MTAAGPVGGEQRVRVDLHGAGSTRVAADVRATPAGLLSIGAMVSGILLASAAIVLSAGRVRRSRRG